MHRKTVSVVMATYDGAAYVADQLRSVIGQTLPPAEIVVSDDGSTDGTLDIVRRLGARGGVEIRILENADRIGFRDNFLRASSAARGDFIAFCDQDDVWRADKIETCARFFDDARISLIVHGARTIDTHAEEIGAFRQGMRGTRIRPPLSYDPWSTFWGFSILFRRDLLRIADADDRFVDYIDPAHPIAHDRWITFLGQMVGMTAEIDEPLVDYRQHRGNLFGAPAGRRSATRVDIGRRSRLYIEATLKMRDIVRSLPATTGSRFPAYDADKCVAFVEAALCQLSARDAIYAAEGRARALGSLYGAVREGRYRNVHDGAMRWASLARDLAFVVARR
jgi:glycosyltransferase involved in cell wall biosynthesis